MTFVQVKAPDSLIFIRLRDARTLMCFLVLNCMYVFVEMQGPILGIRTSIDLSNLASVTKVMTTPY